MSPLVSAVGHLAVGVSRHVTAPSGVGPDRPLALSDNNGRSWATKQKSIKPHQLQASALDLSDVRSRMTAMRNGSNDDCNLRSPPAAR